MRQIFTGPQLRGVAFTAAMLVAAPAFETPARAKATKAPVSIAIINFDYSDTSGEPRNQTAEHEARRAAFMEALRRDLEKSGYRVVDLDCGRAPCTVTGIAPDALFEAAQKGGARLLLYGGVHKMSTLVQWLKVQLVDVEKNRLVDDRLLSFRGDTDDAWRRAEQFLVKQIVETRIAE